MTRLAPRPWEEAYRRQGRLWGGVRLDPWTARLIESVPVVRGLRWLDAGCGDGKGLVPLAAALGHHDVVGADVATWALRRLRERGDPAGRRVVRGDACSWPFPDGAFGVVRAVHLVGHLRAEDRPQALAELHRVLAPGGHLVLAEFGTGDFRYGKGEEVEPDTFRRGFGVLTHYFRKTALHALVEDAGFRITASDTERFTVDYGGETRSRERHLVTAVRPHPGV